jgi:GNAT superfamily N-acetyltransferase
MSPAYVRVATPDDDATIASMRRAWTEEYAGEPIEDPDFDAEFAAWMERERGQRITWLADLEGDPVGMLNLVVFTRMPRPHRATDESRHPTQWGYIANVYVAPEARNRGAGAALLQAAIDHADNAGYARLVLSPTEQARTLYERVGFGEANGLMVRPGQPGWV